MFPSPEGTVFRQGLAIISGNAKTTRRLSKQGSTNGEWVYNHLQGVSHGGVCTSYKMKAKTLICEVTL